MFLYTAFLIGGAAKNYPEHGQCIAKNWDCGGCKKEEPLTFVFQQKVLQEGGGEEAVSSENGDCRVVEHHPTT